MDQALQTDCTLRSQLNTRRREHSEAGAKRNAVETYRNAIDNAGTTAILESVAGMLCSALK